MNRILIIVLVVLLCVGGWFLWRQHTTGSAFGDGTVVENRTSTADDKTAAMNTGATTNLDGESIDAHPTPSRSDAPGTINTEPVVPGASTNQPPAVAGTQGGMVAPPNGRAVAGPAGPIPVGDTIAPNPPNGAVFTGTGKFQWYRQGNITWRVDSASGSYCIAFATMEEWQKPIVFQNGCGSGRG